MSRPNIIIDDNIPFLIDRIAGKADITVLPASEITPEAVRDADAVLVRTRTKCDASLLEGSKVKMVFSATIGADHIDKEWCESHGISAGSASGCNSPAVAQYVIAALSKAGFDPQKHTLGVVGKGHIGSLVTELVRRAGGKVLVSDPPRSEDGYMDELYQPLDKLLPQCDAVTFHVPLKRSGKHPTVGLLNRENIPLLKDKAIVINASRGGVLDEKAVLESDRNDIRWIIDTWENEPAINPEMVALAEISTPHIAGYSLEGKERATRRTIEKLNEIFDLDIPADGLADYDFDLSSLTFGEVASSYDILRDSHALKQQPGELEHLRDYYPLRSEPTHR